jgi:hypothetical protein
MFHKAILFFTTIIFLSSSLVAEGIDLSTAEGVAKANRKIQCSLIDGKPVTYYWYGNAFGRRLGMSDKLLFKVEGMNVRSCSTVRDKSGNYGWKLVTREILLYKDTKSGEVLRNWLNPYTNEEVEVMHVANDPVNQPPQFGLDRQGEVAKFRGDFMDERWWSTATIPLYYNNTLGGDYQQYIGGTYRATEMFNFFGDIESLLDEGRDTANVQVGWVRHSDWLPWMKMAGRDGIIYMHSAGKKLKKWADLSETMKNEIATNYPEYTSPPPSNDQRPNETSWTVFKKEMEQRGGPKPIKREFPH